jgi:catalase (peroxidase I)
MMIDSNIVTSDDETRPGAARKGYASSDGHSRFVKDFVRVWDKVMMLDRFDVRT